MSARKTLRRCLHMCSAQAAGNIEEIVVIPPVFIVALEVIFASDIQSPMMRSTGSLS